MSIFEICGVNQDIPVQPPAAWHNAGDGLADDEFIR